MGLLDLTGLGHDLTCGPLGREGQHQAVGEGPALAAVVAQVLHLQAHFLGHLALDAVLQRFAGLDEAGEGAEHAGHEMRRASQQQLGLPPVAPPHQRHHGRAQARIGAVPAGRAAACALARLQLGGRAAHAAMAVGAVPLQHLRGAARHARQGRRHLHHGRAQRHGPPLGGRLREPQCPAIQPVEPAEVVASLRPLRPAFGRRRRHRQVFLQRQQQLALNEAEMPAQRGGRLQGVDGGFEVHREGDRENPCAAYAIYGCAIRRPPRRGPQRRRLLE